jgi:hypothetical protein
MNSQRDQLMLALLADLHCVALKRAVQVPSHESS